MRVHYYPRIIALVARIAAIAAVLIGGIWLLFWFGGVAPRWSAAGVLTVKTNMALGQVLAGAALLLLAPVNRSSWRQRVGRGAALAALLIGALTFSQHLFGYDLGIDQFLATEPPDAAATVSPNRMGVPGSLSLLLLGVGLLLVASPKYKYAPWFGVAVCIVNLIPAVGFLYGVDAFYGVAKLTGIAWSSVVALLSLGLALFISRPSEGPAAQLLRDDPGGILLRHLLPAVVLTPLILGFLTVQGEQRGFYGTAAGSATLVILLVLGFTFILWRTAASLSQSAAAKAESERRFRTLFESMSEAFALHEIICDSAGRPCDYRFLELNAAFERQSGLNRSALLGKTVRQALPDVEEDWISTYAHVAAGGEPVSFERFNASTGRFYSVHAFRPAPGQCACLFLDVTVPKRAEQALRDSEKRYRNLFESIDEGFCILEMLFDATGRPNDWRYLEVNPAFERHNGMERATGRRVLEMVPNLESRWFEIYGKVATTGESLRSEEFSRALNRWFDIFAFRVGDPEERKVAVLFNNITRRKQAEEKQERLAQHLRLALDAARMGWWHYESDTRHLIWDDRYKGLMGISDHQHSLDEILARVHPDDLPKVVAAVQGALQPRDAKPYSVQYRITQADGSVRWIESHAFAVVEGKLRRATGLVGTVQDITERKQFQEELERVVAERTAKLQEVIGELEHYSYTITHDMRAPLRTMRGFAEFMAESCAGCQAHQSREFLGRIIRAATRMDGLITDALTYSKASRQELVLQPVDPGALLSSMLESYPELQPAKARIEIRGRIPVVSANEAGLTQCFSNLLSNAVKFVKEGELPQITIRSEQRDGWVRLWFEDNGIGIPPEALPHLFEMFSRGHHGYDGTGVGLALVRKVVSRLGGKVGVESVPGNGSRFWIELRSANCDPLAG